MPTLPTELRPVTDVPAATSARALDHFEQSFAFETDCADVHAALVAGHSGFVVLDVRSPERYAVGHVPGAANLLSARINERNLAIYAPDTLFVVYCAGPHCNGADHAAIRLARLGRPVKKMVGGIRGGWTKDSIWPAVNKAEPLKHVQDCLADASNRLRHRRDFLTIRGALQEITVSRRATLSRRD
jgi:rhodanese-related sulfurtransferase